MKTAMVWLISVVVLAMAAFGLRKMRPWLERNGWIFPKGQSGSAGKALVNIHSLLEPSKKHVVEWQQDQEFKRVDDESGAPPEPGAEAAAVREAFLKRAHLEDPSLKEVVNAIKAIPHGRPRARSAAGVVEDWRGTCSTKLLLLRAVCPEVPIKFYNRVFRLDRDAARVWLGPAVADVVPPDGMIDVHTFARVPVADRWVTVDLAFPGEDWDGQSDMSIPWGEGEDFDAGEDPIANKEILVQRFGDPSIRRRLIEAISP